MKPYRTMDAEIHIYACLPLHRIHLLIPTDGDNRKTATAHHKIHLQNGHKVFTTLQTYLKHKVEDIWTSVA
jgi:hypothetical protein